jgi:hypothetical protein
MNVVNRSHEQHKVNRHHYSLARRVDEAEASKNVVIRNYIGGSAFEKG